MLPIKAKAFAPGGQSFRFAGYFGLANNPPGRIHNANARAFQRYIDSGIVFHGRPFDDAWSRAIPDSIQSHHHSEGRPLRAPPPGGRPVTPSSLANGATAEALDAVLDLRGYVEELQAVELPKGFGRD
jgi:hypothetical protein